MTVGGMGFIPERLLMMIMMIGWIGWIGFLDTALMDKRVRGAAGSRSKRQGTYCTCLAVCHAVVNIPKIQ